MPVNPRERGYNGLDAVDEKGIHQVDTRRIIFH